MTDAASGRPRRRRFGCLARVAVAVLVLAGVVVAIGEIFDQGPNAGQPVHGYDAGPLDAYQPATVSYLDLQHLYVVRLANGGVLALYDRSARQQELDGDCRVRYDETASIAGAPAVPELPGAFVEDCEDLRTVWRIDGTLASGAGYGDLDRFDAQVDAQGRLIINTASRSCTRSRGVPGVPPYDSERCSGNG